MELAPAVAHPFRLDRRQLARLPTFGFLQTHDGLYHGNAAAERP